MPHRDPRPSGPLAVVSFDGPRCVFFVLVGARTAFSQPGANATPTVVRLVIDSRTYSPADLPAKYSEYVRIATPEERVSDGVPCKGWQRVGKNAPGHDSCVETFFPRYPYHRIPRAVKQKLVRSMREMGGELVDWAFSNGDFVGLGVDDAGVFLLVRLDVHGGRVVSLPPFAAPNSDIQAMMGDPHPFCFSGKESGVRSWAARASVSRARLAMSWRNAALVLCGEYTENGGGTPFFIFPKHEVRDWWLDKRSNDRNGQLLCNIVWVVMNSESGSSRVTIPAMDPDDPNGGRIAEMVTLDLRTGRFFISGKRIYPESPAGEHRDGK